MPINNTSEHLAALRTSVLEEGNMPTAGDIRYLFSILDTFTDRDSIVNTVLSQLATLHAELSDARCANEDWCRVAKWDMETSDMAAWEDGFAAGVRRALTAYAGMTTDPGYWTLDQLQESVDELTATLAEVVAESEEDDDN